MKNEHWNRAEALYHQALQLDESTRAEFLDKECGEDQSLRHDLESLLANAKEAGQFFESPAIMHAGKLLASEMSDPENGDERIGRVVSHYRVLEKLASGGMGLIYKAEDTRLHRFVALKFLPEHFAQDPQWLARFEREAQAASALNHPNICTVHDIGEHEGNAFIAMEFLDGQTLNRVIGGTPLTGDQILDVGMQIAQALQAAHSHGIVHRDVKPANIFLCSSGQVKLLDFGIAKLSQESAAGDRASSTQHLPGQTELTDTGLLVGTATYMSPEQVRGEDLDPRTDLFSFGVVLYEMACGIPPFQGQTPEEVRAAILARTPPLLSTDVGGSSKGLRGIITKALEKNRHVRYQRAAEIGADLRQLKREAESSQFASGVAVAAQTPATRKNIRRMVAFALLLFAGIVSAAFFLRSRPKRASLTERDTVVLTDFNNQTSDPVFSDALKQAFAAELGQSPFLNVMSDRKVNGTLRLMGRAPGERITGDVGREICQRNGAKALINGGISSLGSIYLITLNAIACSTGENLAQEQAQAATKEGVLKALSQASSSLRSKLGESLPSVKKYETPIEATTSSLEALQNYSLGLKVRKEKGPVASIPFFKRAVELDPNFPMAYAALSAAYANSRRPSPAIEYVSKAYQLRDRVTQRERLRISATYFGTMEEEEKAILAYQNWIDNYPRDPQPHLNLGVTYARIGQHEKALPEIKQALELDPDSSLYYADLLFTCLTLNRFDEAQAAFDLALARGLDSGEVRVQMYALAFVRGDKKAMEKQLAWFAGKPGEEDLMLSTQSDSEAYYGHMRAARDFSRKAADSALRAGSKEAAALWQVNAALREAEIGETTTARKGVASALSLSQGRDVKIVAALALARIGDRKAETLATELAKEFPTSTLLKVYWLPTIHAALELRWGNSGKALEQLEEAKSYELGITSTFVNNLYPAYVRGQAFLLARDGQSAAAEFQKLLDRPGLTVNFVTGSIAHLQLGRAYAMAGDPVKAKKAYQDFFDLWKKADSDLAILKRAKAEFVQLR